MFTGQRMLRASLPLWGALLLSACQVGAVQVNSPSEPPSPTPPDVPPVVTPEPPRGPMAGLSPMRLLTRYEYDNTLSDLFGVTVAQAQAFPTENLSNGFENNAWAHSVNPLLLSRYGESAEAVSAQVLADAGARARLIPCEPMGQEAACAEQTLRAFLPRAFRRPITDEELQHNLSLFAKALPEHGFDGAMAHVIEAVLQSPQLLYRLELTETSAMSEPPQDGGMNDQDFELIGPYEMASRLSYFLWASMPDDALLEAAASGELNTPAQLQAQVARMLDDARARRMVQQFHRQWLHTDTIDSLVKSTQYYPEYTRDLNGDWRVSLEAFIDYAYWDAGTFDALMTSPAIFLTPALAPIYGVEVPAETGGVFRHDAPAGERAGLLTQPGLMALLANPNQGSPIFRGIFVRERVLCQVIPPPPNDVEIAPPDPDPNATTREIFAQHTADDQCAGCHALIDPIGFGFENYDGVGRYRVREHNLPVDATGSLQGSGDPSADGDFIGGVGLAERLAGGEAVQQCLARQWFQLAMGRPHDASDKPSLDAIVSRWRDSGWAWRALFEGMALSDSFRYRKKAQAEVNP